MVSLTSAALPFSQIRAVAFDLDGTLADSVPGLAQALDLALTDLCLPAAGVQRVKDWVGNGADIMVQRALNWALAQPASAQSPALQSPVLQSPALRTLPQPTQQHLRQQFDHHYQHCATGGSILYADVAETLASLHAAGLPLAIVTNKPSPFIAPILASLRIDQYFSLVLGGDDVSPLKPHPAALFLVLGSFGLLPSQLLFVGDSRNDILAAKAAGCPCVGMTYGYNYGEPIANSQPDQVLEHFSGLLQLLALPLPFVKETPP